MGLQHAVLWLCAQFLMSFPSGRFLRLPKFLIVTQADVTSGKPEFFHVDNYNCISRTHQCDWAAFSKIGQTVSFLGSSFLT
jgi:hypothetical protein